MYKKTRASLAGIILLTMMALATIAGSGTASAAASGRAGFVAEAREAGLSTKQATGLQSKVDTYLTKLAGKGTQVSPNQIDLKGAVLNVAVPGEGRPRQLGAVRPAVDNAAQCSPTADYYWFCAYQNAYRGGDNIGMYSCGAYPIPWFTTGSWENNQTRGTVPTAYFTDGSTWRMPGAYYYASAGVNWSPVTQIVNC
ncbi:hypothetical protein OG900_38540 [Streptomyces sp. NBC_00433]